MQIHGKPQVYIEYIAGLTVLVNRQVIQVANLLERKKFKTPDEQRFAHSVSVQVSRVQVPNVRGRFARVIIGQILVVRFRVSVTNRRYATSNTAFDEQELIDISEELQFDTGMLEACRQAETR